MTALRHLALHSRLTRVWTAALVALTLLGYFRIVTNAEFALASAAIIPVFSVSWAGGLRHGLAVATIAAMMWLISGWWVVPAHLPHWILVLNVCVRLTVYLCVAALTARVRTLLWHEAETGRRECLTGLLNRRAFYEAGHTEMMRAGRYGHGIAVGFIDLDRFKRLNDSQGHGTGDTALRAVASALTKALRQTDYVARLGGDEFGIILPEIDAAGATVAAHKLAGQVAVGLKAFPPVSASIGLAWFERVSDDFGELLQEADILMYQVKSAGVGGIRIRHFTSPVSPETADSALNTGRLPIVNHVPIGEKS